MSYSIAEFQKNRGLSTELDGRCYLCHFRALTKDPVTRLKTRVNTFKGNIICLPCLTMKEICYGNPDGLKLRI
jgi:hypothetical protein